MNSLSLHAVLPLYDEHSVRALHVPKASTMANHEHLKTYVHYVVYSEQPTVQPENLFYK